jgi:bifunctional oligoribonuclease and PAP phosphatase NrnA
MNESNIDQIDRKIRDSSRILIVSHVRPDGDAVGSLLGLGLALEEVGKQVQMVLSDGVPATFRHLSGSDRVVKSATGRFDLIITVDCSDLQRLGDALEGVGHPDINIDHHITNLEYADHNLVDPSAVATAELLARFFPKFDLPLSQSVSEALLTGIITDTIGFRTTNMTPQALRVAAELMERGVDLPDLYSRALLNRTYEATRLWGVGLSKLQREGPLLWTTLTLADRKAVEYPGRDDADLVNVLASVADAVIVVLFMEQNSTLVKVSWRSQPGYDVSKLALSFGGGGHPAAAGADISGTLSEVQGKVLKATRALISGAPSRSMTANID